MQVHPDTEIFGKAISIMNYFVNDIFERFASEASRLAQSAPRLAAETSRPLYVSCFAPWRVGEARCVRENHGGDQVHHFQVSARRFAGRDSNGSFQSHPLRSYKE